MRLALVMPLAAWTLVLAAAAGASAAGEDHTTSYTEAGREMVDGSCATCHSMRLVRQQRLTRRDWDEVIDEMISEHDMAAPETGERQQMLDDLERRFGRRVAR